MYNRVSVTSTGNQVKAPDYVLEQPRCATYLRRVCVPFVTAPSLKLKGW